MSAMTFAMLCRATAMLALSGCTANDDIHAPALANVSPSHAMPGTQVRIEGNYFCLQSVIDDMDPFACHVMGSVLFGASVTSASQYTDTLITAEVPSAPPGALRVSVLVGARSSNALEFVVE